MRSVEAATRDDAIAAAREQFGPHARVVGVRRVRSGGVLGFFTTERYVAEVADQFGRPGAPAPSAGSAQATPVSSFESPLASAAPARARATAPARNGAAAWAAEAARSAGTDRGPATGARPAPTATADHERLDELAGLLGNLPAAVPRAAAPTSSSWSAPQASRKPSFPATSSSSTASSPAPSAPRAPAEDSPATGGAPRASFPRAGSTKGSRSTAPAPREQSSPAPSPFAAALEAPGAPSPFTAALARMVAGDREVRQAVAQALEEPGVPAPEAAPAVEEAPAALLEPVRTTPEPVVRDEKHPVGTPEPPAPRPSLAAAIRSADPSMRSTTVHQEESTVGEQVVTAPSTSTPAPVDPTWAAAEEIATPAPSTRQEEIAEALRSALAQGHSDEALAGILRKMLAGDSPQEALAEPVEPVETVETAPVVVETPVAETPVVETPVAVELPVAPPVAPLAVVETAAPVAGSSLFAPAVTEPAPSWDLVSSNHSLFGLPAPVPAGSGLGWDAPAPVVTGTPLWGEPATPAAPPVSRTDAPIWADVVLTDPAPVAEVPAPATTALFQETPAEELPVEEPVSTAAPVVEEPTPAVAQAPEATSDAAGGTTAPEVDELAPLLARTASDPAPLTMSMDATTVMPRISVLPARSGSRGRGLPPVPPSTGRPAVPPSRPRAERPAPADTELPSDGEDTAPPAPAPRAVRPPRALATVTRLPVAPLMAGPDVPDMPELDDSDDADETVVPAAVRAADAIVARLTALGLPAQLLGEAFAEAVAADGTYAALTRALAGSLPEVPRPPAGAGDVLFVVGPGLETLRAAQSLAATLRLDPDRVQWATRGDLAGLAPRAVRVTTVDGAVERRQETAGSGSPTIVAVDAPLRGDAFWMEQMLSAWSPTAVWAVVEATRKPEDVEAWLDGLVRVDALAVQDTDLSADPAAVLRRLTVPVALLDGVRATPHRWASLLCERLEDPQA
ncbi:hypothetical protein [Blastococcus sp. TBT05-19]|uniref:hypothetical protein n=1 Tax=Blastococcus sp. TBT05-19 TaxID=2250581 RepID=UPI0011BE7495|nr:hypothetical protein [Blastococcus sp. TBT05-19]